MNEQSILEDLLEILETGGVTVRSERLGGSGGGLCTVKGKKVFFVDTDASSSETAALCAEAVTGIVNIERLYMRPQVRQFLENHCSEVTWQ